MTDALPVTPATVSSEAVAGVRLASDRERDVEHLLLQVGGALTEHGIPVTWLTTHRVVTDLGVACAGAVAGRVDPDLLAGTLYAVSRELADTAGDVDVDAEAALAAATARRDRAEGRAVWFPGHETVGDQITVADLLAGTAIDAVEVLGGSAAEGDTVIRTRNFVRPRFAGGRLVLHTQPAVGGVLVPFETPSPTPCCVDHA